MNHCKLEIFFKFAEIDGKYMGVTVEYNARQSTIIPDDNTVYCYSQDIELPAQIDLEFFGKNKNQDTKIDEHGNIVQDKHVIIKEIKLDNISIDPLFIKRHLALTHDSGINYSNYIGFNGNMIIQFEKNNVFSQVLHFNYLGMH
jgi:hypothetical protein